MALCISDVRIPGKINLGENTKALILSSIDRLLQDKDHPVDLDDNVLATLFDEIKDNDELENKRKDFAQRVLKLAKSAKAAQEKLAFVKETEEMSKEMKESDAQLAAGQVGQTIDPVGALYQSPMQRERRIQMMSNLVSTAITNTVNKFIEILSERSDKSGLDEFNCLNPDRKRLRVLTDFGRVVEDRVSFMDSFRNDFNAVVAMFNALRDTANEDEESWKAVADAIFNDGETFSDNMLVQVLRSQHKVEVEGRKRSRVQAVRNNADSDEFRIQKLKAMSAEYAKMTPDIVDGLIKEASLDIQFRENIAISFDSSGNTKVSKAQEEDEDNSKSDDDEKKDVGRSGLGIVRSKELDPAKSLSTRMKRLFANCVQIAANGTPIFDTETHVPLYMNPKAAFYKCLGEFQNMFEPEMFDEMLGTMAKKYPWFQQIVDQVMPAEGDDEAVLKEKESLHNELYRTLAKSFVESAMVTEDGKIKILNRDNNATFIAGEAKNNYEARNVFTPVSLYGSDGMPNVGAIDKVRYQLGGEHEGNLYDQTNKLKRLPAKNGRLDVDALMKAVARLRGEHQNAEGTQKWSVQTIIACVGLNPDFFDINDLVPAIAEEDLDAVADMPIAQAKDFLEKKYHLEEVSKKLQKIFGIVNGIAGFYTGDAHGKKHIVDNAQSSYLALAQELSSSATLVDETSFNFGDKKRQSYAASDMIDLFATRAQKSSTKKWKAFMDKTFGKYDFYKNGKDAPYWLHTLEALTDDEVRKRIKKQSILGLWGNDPYSNTIDALSPQDFSAGIALMYSKNRKRVGKYLMSTVSNPLYSDVDAMTMLNLPVPVDEEDKQEMFEQYAKHATDLAVAEALRIQAAYATPDGMSNVEFYAKNSKLFNFFPFLNNDPNVQRELRLRPTNGQVRNELKTAIYEAILNNIKDEYDEFGQSEIGEATYMAIFREIQAAAEEEKKQTSKQEDEWLSDDEKLGTEKTEEEIAAEKEEKEKQAREDEAFIEEYEATSSHTAEDDERYKKLKPLDVAAQKRMKEFYLNFSYMQKSQMAMFSGDLAYYKNFTDYVKRAKEMYSCGERGYFLTKDENGALVPIMEKCIYAGDVEGTAFNFHTLQEIYDFIDTSTRGVALKEADKASLNGILYMFRGMCETDGQSLRTIESFKTIYTGLGGKWSDQHDEAMEAMKHASSDKAAAIKGFIFMLQSLKPFMISSEDRQINGRTEKVFTQHKNSEFALTAAYSMFNMVFNESPRLKAIQRFMENNKIDVLHFNSCVKHGYDKNSAFDLEHDDMKYEMLQAIDPEKYKERSAKDYLERLKQEFIDNKISQEDYEDEYNKLTFQSKDNDTSRLNAKYARETKGKDRATDLNEMRKAAQKKHKDALEIEDDAKRKKALAEAEKALAEYKEALKKWGTAEDRLYEKMQSHAEYYNEQSVNPYVHSFPLTDMMIVQPTDDHLIGEFGEKVKALFGSQLRNIIDADLNNKNEVVSLKVGGKNKQYTIGQLAQAYDELISWNLVDSFKKVNGRFSSIEKLAEYLQQQIEGDQQYGDDVREALKLVTNENGEKVFAVPLNAPNIRNKVESLLLSAFKNAIQRQEIKGGSAVLVSSFGLSTDLKILWKDPKDHSKGMDGMEVYLPAMYSEAYKDFMDEHGNVDMKKLKAADVHGDLLDAIAYRIPTEDKYSIMHIKVKGFLSPQSGSNIIMPREVITMSGTDFDIDKMFLMLKDFDRKIVTNSNLQEFFDGQLKGALGRLNEKQQKVAKALAARAKVPESAAMYIYAFVKNLDAISDDKKNRVIKDAIRALSRVDLSKPIGGQSVDAMLDNRIIKGILNKIGYKLEYESYSSDEDLMNTKLEGKNATRIRNNRLIDIIQGILDSPQGAKINYQSGQYSAVKHASRMMNIAHDQHALNSLVDLFKSNDQSSEYYPLIKAYKATKGKIEATPSFVYRVAKVAEAMALKNGSDTYEMLNKFFDEYGTKDTPGKLLDYAKKHDNLMQGKALIGISAVNSSCHYKFQKLGLKLTAPIKIKINGVTTELTEVDAMYSSLNGRRIGSIMAEYQAAAPDNGKDPVLGDVFANSKTFSRIGFLASLGLDPLAIAMINNKETVNVLLDRKGKVAKRLAEMEHVPEFDGDIERLSDLCSKAYNGQVTEEEMIELASMRKWMLQIESAKDMRESATAVARCDSQNGALPVKSGEVYGSLAKATSFLNTIYDKRAPIRGFEGFINSREQLEANTDIGPLNYIDGITDEQFEKLVKMGRMQVFYTLGIDAAKDVLAEKMPHLNSTSQKIVYTILKNVGYSNPATKQARNFTSAIINTICGMQVQQMLINRYAGEYNPADPTGQAKNVLKARNYYINNFPQEFKEMLENKEMKKKLAKYPIFMRMSIAPFRGIYINNALGTSPLMRRIYTKSFDAMLADNDPQIRQLAVKMAMYEAFNSGFGFGRNNISLYMSSTFLNAVTDGEYSKVLQNQQNALDDIAREGNLNIFMDAFMQSHPTAIFDIPSKYAAIIRDAKGYHATKNGNDAFILPSNSVDRISRYYKMNNKYFKLESTIPNADGNYVYHQMKINSTGVDDTMLLYLSNWTKAHGLDVIDELKSRGSAVSANDIKNAHKILSDLGLEDVQPVGTEEQQDRDTTKPQEKPDEVNVAEKANQAESDPASQYNADTIDAASLMEQDPEDIYDGMAELIEMAQQIVDGEIDINTADIAEKIEVDEDKIVKTAKSITDEYLCTGA